jgi:hypothetical protein
MSDESKTIHDTGDGRMNSEQLAALIVDALLRVGLVRDGDVRRAIEIAAEEIEVRKIMGDY